MRQFSSMISMRNKKTIFRPWLNPVIKCVLLCSVLHFVFQTTIIILNKQAFIDSIPDIVPFVFPPIELLNITTIDETASETVTERLGSSSGGGTKDVAELTVEDSNHEPIQHHALPPEVENAAPINFDKGGLIFFFHIPKTGGTSIRDEVQSMKSDFEFITSDNRSGKNDIHVFEKRINEYMKTFSQSSDHRIRFVEFHGKHTTFADLYPTLKRWREQAAAIRMPFFVFSMVRDPINAQISIFNFFCIQIDRYVKCGVPHTIEGLLKKCPRDPQTRWLCHSTETFFPEGEFDCPHLHDQIIEQMDWVGKMESFSETIAVLNDVISPRKLKGLHKNKPNKRRGGVVRSELNETMIERMESLTKVDRELYKMVNVNYHDRMLDH